MHSKLLLIFVILWTVSQAVEDLEDLIATATFGDKIEVRVPAPTVTNGKVSYTVENCQRFALISCGSVV